MTPDDNPMQMNPAATKIAQKYGLEYDEVVQWYDKGYAPQEIERAYHMGEDKDAEVADILAMRDAGMDWRAIEKALDTMPDVGDDDDDDSAFGESPHQRRKQKRKK
jgi:hypothetical protein